MYVCPSSVAYHIWPSLAPLGAALPVVTNTLPAGPCIPVGPWAPLTLPASIVLALLNVKIKLSLDRAAFVTLIPCGPVAPVLPVGPTLPCGPVGPVTLPTSCVDVLLYDNIKLPPLTVAFVTPLPVAPVLPTFPCGP